MYSDSAEVCEPWSHDELARLALERQNAMDREQEIGPFDFGPVKGESPFLMLNYVLRWGFDLVDQRDDDLMHHVAGLIKNFLLPLLSGARPTKPSVVPLPLVMKPLKISYKVDYDELVDNPRTAAIHKTRNSNNRTKNAANVELNADRVELNKTAAEEHADAVRAAEAIRASIDAQHRAFKATSKQRKAADAAYISIEGPHDFSHTNQAPFTTFASSVKGGGQQAKKGASSRFKSAHWQTWGATDQGPWITAFVASGDQLKAQQAIYNAVRLLSQRKYTPVQRAVLVDRVRAQVELVIKVLFLSIVVIC